MKIIKPSVEFLGAVPTDYAGALAFIEQAGRVCYKSESKGDPEKFVRKLIASGHLAMVEHSNFVVRTKRYVELGNLKGNVIGKFLNYTGDEKYDYVGGNLTAWHQAYSGANEILVFEPFQKLFGDLFGTVINYNPNVWQVCPHNEIPKELHRYSAKFICDRGVSHELVRHRPCSFAQESTRYVNYAGKDMEFIEPWWLEEEQSNYLKNTYLESCVASEQNYGDFIAFGRTPQAARAVLPNALKTEIIVTAGAAEWAHIRKLRTAKDAHPDMQRVMNMMPWEEFL